jgi:Domain of unknown function (DUF4189)
MRYGFTCASIIMACSLPLASAWAGWGCGYRFSGLEKGHYGAVWAYPSRKEARAAAMKLCENSGARGCRIVDCGRGIDDEKQAHVRWPLKSPVGVCVGSGCK